ncbi:hypothetical protein GCM10008966_09510 [Rhodovulum strictum]
MRGAVATRDRASTAANIATVARTTITLRRGVSPVHMAISWDKMGLPILGASAPFLPHILRRTGLTIG